MLPSRHYSFCSWPWRCVTLTLLHWPCDMILQSNVQCLCISTPWSVTYPTHCLVKILENTCQAGFRLKISLVCYRYYVPDVLLTCNLACYSCAVWVFGIFNADCYPYSYEVIMLLTCYLLSIQSMYIINTLWLLIRLVLYCMVLYLHIWLPIRLILYFMVLWHN